MLNLHKVSAYSLRSSIAAVLSIPRESGTFQHLAATTFHKFPVAIRNITEYNSFCCSVKRHLLCKELEAENTIVFLFFMYILFLELIYSVLIVVEEHYFVGYSAINHHHYYYL